MLGKRPVVVTDPDQCRLARAFASPRLHFLFVDLRRFSSFADGLNFVESTSGARHNRDLKEGRRLGTEDRAEAPEQAEWPKLSPNQSHVSQYVCAGDHALHDSLRTRLLCPAGSLLRVFFGLLRYAGYPSRDREGRTLRIEELTQLHECRMKPRIRAIAVRRRTRAPAEPGCASVPGARGRVGCTR